MTNPNPGRVVISDGWMKVGPYSRSVRASLRGRRVKSLARMVDCTISTPFYETFEALLVQGLEYAKWIYWRHGFSPSSAADSRPSG